METNISCIRSASFGSKLNQLWISEFRRDLFDVGHHLLLKLVHDRRLHGLHVRKPEELTGLEGRAVDFDVHFHVGS